MRPARRALARLLVIVAFVAATACGGSDGGTSGSGGTAGGTGGASGGGTATTVDLASRVERFDVPPWRHVSVPVEYPQTPPVGGNHIDAWMNCGYYAEPVVNEAAVHSMEHGAAWITFRPGLPQAQKDRIKALTRLSDYVLASPWLNESLPAPIVASAWGLQLKVQSTDDPALESFVRTYANGPQTPEKGARCSGAFGNPE